MSAPQLAFGDLVEDEPALGLTWALDHAEAESVEDNGAVVGVIWPDRFCIRPGRFVAWTVADPEVVTLRPSHEAAVELVLDSIPAADVGVGPAGDSFVLWGWQAFLPEPYPIRLNGGDVRRCRIEQVRRKEEGWLCGIYKAGEPPVGLRLQVEEAARPTDAMSWQLGPHQLDVA